jgi:uncharacterized protein (DUF697 family)
VIEKEEKVTHSVVEKEEKPRNVGEREYVAIKAVKHYVWWSMGAGLIPVPFVDLAAVTGVQLKMLADLSSIYDVPFQANRVKAVTGALIGSVIPGSLGAASTLLKAVPIVGQLAGAPAMVMFCGASTWALGKVFIQHFESGGTFLNFDPEQVKEHFKTHFEEGRTVTSSLKKDKSGLPA